ncbi:MAG: hypothetical protein V4635_17460 [Bacteroidota bacterium]
MSKIVILFLWSLFFLLACKKNKSSEPGYSDPWFLKSVLAKSAFGSKYYKFIYDENRRLSSVKVVDTVDYTIGNQKEWKVTSYSEVYTYNANNRIILVTAPTYSSTYLYNSINQLEKLLRINSNGFRDSVTFTHNNGIVTGQKGKRLYHYTGNHLDLITDTLTYSQLGNPKTSAVSTVYNYNSNHDMAFAGLFKSYDPLTITDFNSPLVFYFAEMELSDYYTSSIINGKPTRLGFACKRNYKGRYPTSMSLRQEGSFSDNLTFIYNYYELRSTGSLLY